MGPSLSDSTINGDPVLPSGTQTHTENKTKEIIKSCKTMGIWFYNARNVGYQKAEVYCGKGAQAIVLESNDTQTPDWCIGYEADPLQIATFGSENLTWRINDGDWELHVAVSRDRGTTYKEVGLIKILKNYARFNVWICNNCIVLENEDNKLGRASDGESFRFFVATEGGTTESNDPACMLNYMFD